MSGRAEHPGGDAAIAGDAWVVGPDGTRVWGTHGAAGLLVHDPDRGVLLQHRAVWSDQGGTWGMPGGARRGDETAVDAALREAHEEADVPADALDPLALRVLDLGFWSYTTVVADAVRTFEAHVADNESAGLAWVAPSSVATLPLHPGFAAAWPVLDTIMRRRPLIVADIANLVGSRPDGWWRDRAGAAKRMIDELAPLAANGTAAQDFGLDAERVWPRLVCVIEGAARAPALVDAPHGRRIQVDAATGSGDDRIVEVVAEARRRHPDAPVLVASSDRELRGRVSDLGADVVGSRTLLERAGRSAHSAPITAGTSTVPADDA